MAGFKDFIMRGNVVDLAVGVIIGVAFGGIVDSMTKDIINPIIGSMVGTTDFSAYKIGILGVGAFISSVINFVIKAGVVYFVIVKPVQAMMARINPPPAPGAPPPPSAEVALLTEIRDTLQVNKAAAGGSR
ncbi:MAG: large conductance mechanosensitive channel protein MscL [Acidobacteriota bacterium]